MTYFKFTAEFRRCMADRWARGAARAWAVGNTALAATCAARAIDESATASRLSRNAA